MAADAVPLDESTVRSAAARLLDTFVEDVSLDDAFAEQFQCIGPIDTTSVLADVVAHQAQSRATWDERSYRILSVVCGETSAALQVELSMTGREGPWAGQTLVLPIGAVVELDEQGRLRRWQEWFDTTPFRRGPAERALPPAAVEAGAADAAATRAVVEGWLQTHRDGDLPAALAYLPDDVVTYDSYGRHEGLARNEKYLRNAFTAFDSLIEVTDLIVDGGSAAVQMAWELRPKDGGPSARSTSVAFCQVRADRVVRWSEYYDLPYVLRQLGKPR